ncbi:MAG: hypothetical protein H7315_19795, partial [Herminiimonas sp.]|nr:hypothetical protein [Herminiimonas sp.]
MTLIDSAKIIFDATPPLLLSPACAVRPETPFQLLNARVEQSGYRDYAFSGADAAHWNVDLNHIYPSRQNIIFLRNASPPRPIHANRIQLGGKDYGIATILPHTADQIEDFYRCILQEKIGAIVNVAQASDFGWLRPPRYWPDSTPKIFGEFTV